MTPYLNRFLIVFCLVYVAEHSSAIYDPRVTTTKSPERRESVLPWHSIEKQNESRLQIESRSSNWQEARANISPQPAARNWTPWRKASNSEIEQRTQVDKDVPEKIPDQVSEQNPEQIHEQQRSFDFDKFDQHENLRTSPEFEKPSELDKNYGRFKDEIRYGNHRPQNTIDTEYKHPSRNDDIKETHVEFENEDLYEGVATDSTKPRKENLVYTRKPQRKVAKYDSRLGVQCPDRNSTGQFVYPPDCKFFVNCWKGRAFVQPCAPGTHFNPDTLECDFPYKVKCYEEEYAEFKEPLFSESQMNPKLEKLQEPKCPPYLTGLLPHHGDCTKFVQCANGATIIMNCGPGTVFNPNIGVCDWPRNVKGCEDEKIPLTPPDPYGHDKSKYIQVRKIMCPPDFIGLLPHPETCKKFLQCASGVTYVMDCGPGTAFNPITTVCDWPYNVPGCKTDKSSDELHKIGSNTWSPFGEGTTSRSISDRYNHTTDSRNIWLGYDKTTSPSYRSTWRPFTTTSSPRWIPTWTTARPPYGHPEPNTDYHDRYGHMHEENRYINHELHRSEWEPTNENLGRPTDSNYGFQGDPDRQRAENERTGQESRGTHHFEYPERSWPHQQRTQDHPYGHRYYPPGYHYHHHHHHYHGYGSPSNLPANPHWDSGTPTATTAGKNFDQGYHEGYAPSTDDSHRRFHHDHHHDPRYPGYPFDHYAAPSDMDQRQFQPHFPIERNDDDTQLHNTYNRTKFGGDDNVNQTGYNSSPNRQDYGRTSPGFYHPVFNRTFSHHGNISLNTDNKYDDSWNQTQTGLRQNRLLPPWIKPENTTTWNQSGGSTFKPSSWRGQQSREGHTQIPTVPVWNQGVINQDDKLHQWQSGSDIYQQSTIDREADAKMSQWASRTNIFPNLKDQLGSDSKNVSQYSKINPYSNGIYVNANGIKGHYITKEIVYTEGPPRIHQSHIIQKPISWNKTFNNTDNNYPPIPATDLQPPPYQSVNHPSYVNVTSSGSHYVPIVYWRPNYHPTNRSNHTNSISNNSNYAPIFGDVYPFHNQSHNRPNASPLIGNSNDLISVFNITPTTERFPNKESELPRKGKVSQNATGGKEPRSFRIGSESNIPSVSIEQVDQWSSDTKISNADPEFPDIVESEINDYDVDVLDDKKVWKPRLVFENKTEATTASSVIMKIGPKKTDVELFNIEAAPFREEDPPFPIYYVQPVRSLSHSDKSIRPTPISGQVIRLRGGSGPNDGYVEVQGAQPGWGSVCDSRNSWTLKEAHILCRQLGYIRGAEMAWQGRNNRNGVPTWIAANTVTCLGNETRFQLCKFTHNQDCRVDRDAIGVRCASNRIAHCRKDEIPHNGQCYHLVDPDNGLNHAEALEYCVRRNARLVDITSQAENNFISEWLSQSYPEVSSVMTSGFGFSTMNHVLWLWEDSVHAKFKFTKWWPGWMNDTRQPPWVGSRPLCIVMSRKFPCYERPESTCDTDYFFWDTEDCSATSKGHSFICERPYENIGCVYGKGNQYMGKANVTLSGNACLPWADERIAHQLRVNVINKEIQEKLKTHNYCRNPNPAKESRPWCFTGPMGKREYCDIPACGNIDPKRSMLTGQCKPKHFECMPGECIPSPWVCDGEEDCTNGADERSCAVDLNLFEKSAKHKLEGYDVEKWLNTPLKTCALRCKEADFTCRSFNHKSEGNVCLLSDSNIGLTGALKPDKDFDYYEMRERSVNCDGMYLCNNRKCINQTQVCNGKNDCNDRSDESICTAENLDYDIRLAGTNNSYEGRVEVKVLGHWGQVCDDGFGMINADVICKELGFVLGALEVRAGGFYGNLDPSMRFMVDQLKCRGNETTLRECDFNGWGVHNCQPEEAVGVVCKTAVNTCQEGHWKCDNSPACIPTPFICDEVVDCPDHSDESPEHCDAPFELRLTNGTSPLQGRVEVRHHGVWGTICDDDFTNATAAVICRSLGYGGLAIAKKDGFFGPGQGPIWLDEVFCHGNESQLYRCVHNHWGQHNCDHNEDAGVICSPGDVNGTEPYWEKAPEHSAQSIDELLPANCGKRAKDFNEDDELVFAKVVHGSIAPKGTYPWQASIRVRGHSRSNHWCGAVIVSPLHVLTAAHCLEGYNKGTYFVRAGDYNTDIDEGTEVEANIEDYYVHEEFRKGHRMNNDIALVLLKGHGIPLGKDIMPICLPSENTEYSPGLNCTISGFGSIETGKTTQSKNLRYGWVPLLDQSICRAGYVYGEGAISDGMMCAGYLDEGIDTCDGDSGGPLACYRNGAFTLYGITSWGQHCGKANKPGVYVRVAHYRRWIDKKIRESFAGR